MTDVTHEIEVVEAEARVQALMRKIEAHSPSPAIGEATPAEHSPTDPMSGIPENVKMSAFFAAAALLSDTPVPASASPVDGATQPTWLIESPEGRWWREHPAVGYGWRNDANEATPYATREECEAAIARVRYAGPTWEGRATEHVFLKAIPPASPVETEATPEHVSAKDVLVVAKLLDVMRDEAVKRSSGVMLSWDNAKGFALVLHAAAKQIAASESEARSLREALAAAQKEAKMWERECGIADRQREGSDEAISRLASELRSAESSARSLREDAECWRSMRSTMRACSTGVFGDAPREAATHIRAALPETLREAIASPFCAAREPGNTGYTCNIARGHDGDHRCEFGEDEEGPVPPRIWPTHRAASLSPSPAS